MRLYFFLIDLLSVCFPCGRGGICSWLGGSSAANILAALKTSKSSWLQTAGATHNIRANITSASLDLFSTFLPQHFDKHVSSCKANLWEESRHHTCLLVGTD